MLKGTMLQYFHWYLPADGTLWKQIKNDAPRLKELGFTAIWLPPACKASTGGHSTGYDIYDLYDLGEFDQKGSVRTKYGTKQEYIEALEAIRATGMQAIVDIVLNHKAGGDEIEKIQVVKVNPDNRNEIISEPFEIEGFTKFTFPGRQKKYSDFEWNYMCFTGVDYASNLSEDGVFRILNGNGDSWQEMIGDEKGNYDYLMYNDIDFRNPAVREELHRWGKWYFEQAQFDGVRLDAVKHIPASFYNEWLDNLRQSTGKEIFAVGEYWAPGHLPLLVKYIEATHGRMSVFDSSLHHNFHNASNMGNDFDMRTIFDDTLVKIMPDKAVTVISNHDTQPLQALEAPVEPWFKPIAYALTLLRDEGYPCVFYPDLFGANYKDYGKDGNEYDIWMPGVENIEKLLQARREHAYGTQRDYFDHANCIGWTREGDDEHRGCAVVISNGDNGNKTMEMGKRYAGKTFIDMMGKNKAKVKINKDGWGEFFAPAGGVSVWVQKTK
ncbi:alpha-amylase [Ginsengibacter hankyongi]|uniref:Alpha-amylase n=1 Tax=Ginsengibacter hankyongi TaxID=2607284 RepID=A0A5J5ILY9_9BACT|nr:alpha-amylase [Ginsengibacter hankyongi]KAA9042020.1 alpha-amylase [Ginsengibacter hankyongi]